MILLACEKTLAAVLDSSKLEKQIADTEAKIRGVMDDVRQLVADNARRALDQAEYERQYKELGAKLGKLTIRQQELAKEVTDKQARGNQIRAYMKTLAEQELLDGFDEDLWNATVEKLAVHAGSKAAFRWRDGTETEWMIR